MDPPILSCLAIIAEGNEGVTALVAVVHGFSLRGNCNTYLC